MVLLLLSGFRRQTGALAFVAPMTTPTALDFGNQPVNDPSMFDTSMFLDSEGRDMLTCGICLNAINDARRACHSDHFFCRSCLVNMAGNMVAPKCPLCRADMCNDGKGDPGVPAPFVDKMVKLSKIQCTNVDCTHVCEFAGMQAHKRTCYHQEIDCPYKDSGCTAKVKRGQLEDHIRAAAMEHFNMSYEKTKDFEIYTKKKLCDIKYKLKRLDDIIHTSETRFDMAAASQSTLDGKMNWMVESISCMAEAIDVVVNAQMTFAPVVMHHRGKQSATAAQHIVADGREAIKRMRSHFSSELPAVTPPSKQPKNDSTTRGQLHSHSAYAVCSPTYSPYSPTSPSYSPSSPQYSPGAE